MIEKNWEYIIQLTLEEINDIISDTDKAYLYNRIAEDEEVYQLYMRTHSQLGSEEVRRMLEESIKKRQSRTFVKFAVKQAHNWWLTLLVILIVKTILIIYAARCFERWHMEKVMKEARISAAVNSALTTNEK